MGGLGSGRKRMPVETAELSGTKHNENTPQLDKPTGVPEPPYQLAAPEAHDVWDYFAPGLTKAGVLAYADLEALALLCESVANAREAARELQRYGKTYEDAKGNPKLNPWFRVWKESVADVMRISARFGLTPADRAALDLGGNPSGGFNPDDYL